MLNLILFGPPGSGKGTQAALLCQKYGLVHISTGDLFRGEIKRQSPLGLKAQEYIDNGQLVPDEVTVAMFASKLDNEIASGAKGFIFDGFPRTTKQAEALDDLLRKRKLKISRVLSLVVSDDELTQRIVKRGRDSGRSDDTDEKVIRKRITEYNEKTTPVATYYDMYNLLSIIPGEGSIEEIFARLSSSIEVTS
jgi:adenylate kinase